MGDSDILQPVIDEVVIPNAIDVDSSGRFPNQAVAALAPTGLLGLAASQAGLRPAADVVRRIAAHCGSTAMVVLMHYAASVVIESLGPDEIRRAISVGEHLTTLAFSESGSRSHFWAPQGTAAAAGDLVRLDARKSWVTSAAAAHSYIWSSLPLADDGPMTLWLVPSGAAGLRMGGPFDGLGLRGNGSVPVVASGVLVDRQAMLGSDGAGLDVALAEVLPWFLVLSAAFSVGLMEAVTAETGQHLQSTRLEHLDERLADQPLVRVDHARMRLAADQAATLLADTLVAWETGRDDAMLRVLEVKAAAGEAAIAVTDLAMKVCGGAAFRKELGVERRFRDARAARVMAPTTDALLDFVGRAINGMPVL